MNKSFLAIIIILVTSVTAKSQTIGWQNLDLIHDSVFGISTEKAYKELLKGRKATDVVVAVIDSGVDTAHEDLRSVIWTNPGEISGNQIDDDHNGYKDDVHGWNFIGGKTGDVVQDNLEITRIIRRDKDYYDSLSYTAVPGDMRLVYTNFRKMEKEYNDKYQNAQAYVESLSKVKRILDIIISKIGKDDPDIADLEKCSAKDEEEQKYINVILNQEKKGITYLEYRKKLDKALSQFTSQLDYQLNMNFDPRSIVGDNYNDGKEKFYGNNDAFGPSAIHGTHVAGIIGADRNNGLGMNGIADHVKIISVRVVPEGDERDKDVANGIRYAVDNGARIINLSFGKSYSWDKKIVDDAVKYAMDKGVLIIHGAGNDTRNLDNPENLFFPNKFYAGGGLADNWINVGASGWKDDTTLIAPFSNYGKLDVDVFAPGVQIYSTTPGSHYEKFDGTSMAAPVVTGLAALIMEYYPKLTAIQVKDIILKSVVKPDHFVIVKENGEVKKLMMTDICGSGGVVNAYNAITIAETYK